MSVWWNALTAVQQSFAFIAMPATVFLILQLIMQLFGIGHNDGLDVSGHTGDMDSSDGADTDFDLDYSNDFSIFSLAGLRLLTLRGVIAFLSIGGWTGVVLAETTLHVVIIVVLSVIAGLAAAYLLAVSLRAALRLQSSGNLDLTNAIGKMATVYIPVPADRNGIGKVMIVLQDRYTEAEAISDFNQTLLTGSEVEVTGVDNHILVVTPLVKILK